MADDLPDEGLSLPTDAVFHDEAAAKALIEEARWPAGKKCPDCGSDRIHTMAGRTQAGMFLCRDCGVKFTVRTGTVMHRSHVPLHKWLLATHLRALAGEPLSERRISRLIGISPKAGWRLSQSIADVIDAEAERRVGRTASRGADDESAGSANRRRNKHYKFAGRGRMVSIDLAAGTARVGGPEGNLFKIDEVIGSRLEATSGAGLPRPLLLFYARMLAAPVSLRSTGE